MFGAFVWHLVQRRKEKHTANRATSLHQGLLDTIKGKLLGLCGGSSTRITPTPTTGPLFVPRTRAAAASTAIRQSIASTRRSSRSTRTEAFPEFDASIGPDAFELASYGRFEGRLVPVQRRSIFSTFEGFAAWFGNAEGGEGVVDEYHSSSSSGRSL
jgi:hypothetical protein